MVKLQSESVFHPIAEFLVQEPIRPQANFETKALSRPVTILRLLELADTAMRIFYCDPCDTPTNGREDPPNLADGNTETKWLDYSLNGFYLKLPGELVNPRCERRSLGALWLFSMAESF